MANFWALIKAIPGLVKLMLMFKNAYDEYQDNKIEKHYKKKAATLSRLGKKVESAVTDEERKELARRLANLTNY